METENLALIKFNVGFADRSETNSSSSLTILERLSLFLNFVSTERSKSLQRLLISYSKGTVLIALGLLTACGLPPNPGGPGVIIQDESGDEFSIEGNGIQASSMPPIACEAEVLEVKKILTVKLNEPFEFCTAQSVRYKITLIADRETGLLSINPEDLQLIQGGTPQEPENTFTIKYNGEDLLSGNDGSAPSNKAKWESYSLLVLTAKNGYFP